ncbi:uncharacterized protein BDR25DRAFT_349301 [Lindgomyces ingoldianus]|uniref:Uncharacterized protein n=1 Tax=Lindgomyces ingoldianus TaxID=673940 RepID=A0ACB6RAG3_9PLEO|nr:uncharacterized protein BDR25DRAFT_349301 [Lindgomyces ingoldianus]KAF2476176.1 hypothetical protein BDR25DRAFT_349301 [Lindgomyces ingoldianus]
MTWWFEQQGFYITAEDFRPVSDEGVAGLANAGENNFVFEIRVRGVERYHLSIFACRRFRCVLKGSSVEIFPRCSELARGVEPSINSSEHRHTGPFPKSNRTYQIIHDVVKRKYAVGGYLLIFEATIPMGYSQLFARLSVTLYFQGPHFIQFVTFAAQTARVLISVPLDYLMPKDAAMALECAFNLIVIDGTMFDEEGNIDYVTKIFEKLGQKGITTEAEPVVWKAAKTAYPKLKEPNLSLRSPECVFFAPSFGNVHSPYPADGAEKWWKVHRREKVKKRDVNLTQILANVQSAGNSYIFGASSSHASSGNMLRVGVINGMRKENQNWTVRTRYLKFLAKEPGNLEFTQLQEKSVQIYSKEIEQIMKISGPADKACLAIQASDDEIDSRGILGLSFEKPEA